MYTTCNMFFPTKKTFCYNFFPTKEEEEAREREQAEAGNLESRQGGYGRVLVEIRDQGPPPVVDHFNPWVIKKTLNQDEVDSGKLVLTRNDTFEHVLRYFPLSYANHIALGFEVGVTTIWDVTQEKNPKKYDEAQINMVEGDNLHLICKDLMEEKKLKVYDQIGLYSYWDWDAHRPCFLFKLFLNSV